MQNLNKINELFEEYKFDYIYINPENTKDLDFEFIPEEVLVDFVGKPGYIGTIKINSKNIEVYSDKKITPGDVIFKYQNIKKERSVKLFNILHDSFN